MLGDLVRSWLGWVWEILVVAPRKERLPRSARQAHRSGWLKGNRRR